MQIAHGDELPQVAAFRWRDNNAEQIDLLGGAIDGVDNYLLSYGEIGNFSSPRHRHNFEQIRVQLKGELDFGRDGLLQAGMFGYFPEGLAYGPQTSNTANGSNISLVMQCGGASGSGYISQTSANNAYEALSERGAFEGGVYRSTDGEGRKKNTDAFQALWEHVCGRPMLYPQPRYRAVIMTDPENFAWVPVPAQSGVFVKAMGSFTERRTRMALVRSEAGATFRPDANVRDVYFVLAGRGTVDGLEIRPLTAMEFAYGEAPTIRASEDLTLILFGLPDLRDLGDQSVRKRAREPS
jgi:hypothetical protein